MKEQETTDRLLRRNLRAPEDQVPAGSCLDAETIAAWSDGSLSTALRDEAAAHAADCARCLAILAAVAQTEPVRPHVSWAGLLPLRWLVPLTTAATAVFLWVLVDRPPDPAELSSPAEPAAQRSQLRSERPQAAPSSSPASPEAVDSGPAISAPDADIRRDAPAPGVSPPPAAPPAPPATARRTPPPAGASPETDEADTQARTRAVAERSELAETVSVAPPTADAPRADAATQRFSAPAPPGQALEIVSPDPAFRWRIAGTTIERSLDGGRTWLRQSTDSTVPLLAGSAPSPAVCWVAGRSGTVLRTTDGETWTRIPFPQGTDLLAITAGDAVTAAVTTSDARTYRTTDGGRSWTLQENPAAPF